MNYQFVSPITGIVIKSVQRLSDSVFIPLINDNKDCANFIKEWKDGANVTYANNSIAVYSNDAVIALGLTPI